MAPKLKYQILLDLKHTATQGTPSGPMLPLPVPTYSSKSFVAICTIVSYRAHANSLVNDKKKKKHVKRRTLSWIERERKKKDFHYSSKSICDRL